MTVKRKETVQTCTVHITPHKCYTTKDLCVFTTHGDRRKRKYSERQKKWELMGAIEALERFFVSSSAAFDASGKDALTKKELQCSIRIILARYHEKLAEVTGKAPRYTMKQAIEVLKRETGVSVKEEVYND